MKDKPPSKPDSMAIDVTDVRNRMILVRGQSVLFDRDVVVLYGVETKHVNQEVRNNPRRFPLGYVTELSEVEL